MAQKKIYINNEGLEQLRWNLRKITNIKEALNKLGAKEIGPDRELKNLPSGLLLSSNVSIKEEQVRSKVLDAIRPSDLKRLVINLGLEVLCSEQLGYDSRGKTLYLSKEGLLAAVVFSKYFKEELKGIAPLLPQILEEGRLDDLAGQPTHVAAGTLFFLHLLSKGVDGAVDSHNLNFKVFEDPSKWNMLVLQPELTNLEARYYILLTEQE